jgi:hypothetical protein
MLQGVAEALPFFRRTDIEKGKLKKFLPAVAVAVQSGLVYG